MLLRIPLLWEEINSVKLHYLNRPYIFVRVYNWPCFNLVMFLIGDTFYSTLYRPLVSWCASNQSFIILHIFHLVDLLSVLSVIQTHGLEATIILAYNLYYNPAVVKMFRHPKTFSVYFDPEEVGNCHNMVEAIPFHVSDLWSPPCNIFNWTSGRPNTPWTGEVGKDYVGLWG